MKQEKEISAEEELKEGDWVIKDKNEQSDVQKILSPSIGTFKMGFWDLERYKLGFFNVEKINH